MVAVEMMSGILHWAMDHPILFIVSATVACLVLAACQFGDRWRMRKVPGTFGRFILGDVPEVQAESVVFFMDRLYRQYSNCKVFKIWLGPYPMVVIRDVDLAKKMAMKFITRSPIDFLTFKTGLDRKIWSNILVVMNGAKWRLGRRATEASVMHPKALLAQAPSVVRCTERLVTTLDTYAASGEPVDVQVCTYAMAMDAIGWAAFGMELHSSSSATTQGSAGVASDHDAIARLSMAGTASASKTGPEAVSDDEWWLQYPPGSPEFGLRLVKCAITCMRAMEIESATIYTAFNLLLPRLQPLWVALSHVVPDKKLTVERQAMRGLCNACKVMIDAWKMHKLPAGAGADGAQPGPANVMSDQGFLARLLSGADFTKDDILEDYEVTGLAVGNIVAGYDTTGTTIAMALYHLAGNPEVQAKAQQEVDTVMQGKAVLIDDLERLPYINAVFQETIRVSPAAPIFTRCIDEPYDMGDSIVLPAGTYANFPTYSYHRDPALWPRALEFLPERHLGNQDLATTNPNAYMPFGAGARMCVGYKFATLEVRMALANLMQRFTFARVPGLPAPTMKSGLTMAADKVVLNVQRRNGKP